MLRLVPLPWINALILGCACAFGFWGWLWISDKLFHLFMPLPWKVWLGAAIGLAALFRAESRPKRKAA